MKENRLISMVEFVLNDDAKKQQNLSTHSMVRTYPKFVKYANFLNQPLNISFFVPAVFDGGKWVVLDESKNYLDFEDTYKSVEIDSMVENWYRECKQYQQAKDKVIFEGFEVKYHNCKEFKYQSEKIFFILSNDDCIEYNCYWKNFQLYIDGEYDSNIKTIEDLIKYKPTLTQYGQKQSGLCNGMKEESKQ